jgi:hypothetical protein
MTLREVQAITVSTATVIADQSTPVGISFDTAARQGGALLCDWGTPDSQSNGDAGGWLSVHVLPDATAAEEHVVGLGPQGVDPSRTCDSGNCWHAGMVAGNDVEIQWGSFAHAHDLDGGQAAFQPIVTTITDRLATPGARLPRWIAPDGPRPTTYCDGGNGREQFIPAVAGALGLDPADVTYGGGTGGDTGVLGAAESRTEFGGCGWGPKGDGLWVFVFILRGGSWALAPARSTTAGAIDAADPAYPGAFVTDDGHGNNSLALSSKGSLVRIDLEPSTAAAKPTLAEAKPVMIAVAKALGL